MAYVVPFFPRLLNPTYKGTNPEFSYTIKRGGKREVRLY